MTDVSAYERTNDKGSFRLKHSLQGHPEESYATCRTTNGGDAEVTLYRNPSTSFAVIQVLPNALVMFQVSRIPTELGSKRYM
jgi:hypothetical protein